MLLILPDTGLLPNKLQTLNLPKALLRVVYIEVFSLNIHFISISILSQFYPNFYFAIVFDKFNNVFFTHNNFVCEKNL